MTRITRTAAAVTGTVALGVGLGVAGLASAAPTPSPSASPSASSSAAPSDKSDFGGRGGHGPRGDWGMSAQQLAEKLGVDEAEVRTALQDYREATRPTTKPDPGTPRTEDDTALATALADALDVDKTKVTTALAEIRSARQAERTEAVAQKLAEAVKTGTLTQTEADAVQKAADAGIVHVGR